MGCSDAQSFYTKRQLKHRTSACAPPIRGGGGVPLSTRLLHSTPEFPSNCVKQQEDQVHRIFQGQNDVLFLIMNCLYWGIPANNRLGTSHSSDALPCPGPPLCAAGTPTQEGSTGQSTKNANRIGKWAAGFTQAEQY